MKPDSEGIILRTGLQSSNSMKPVLRRYGQRRFFSLLRQQLFENRENRSPINMNCVRVFCDTKTTAGGVGLIWGPPGPRSWQWALGVWDGHRQDRGPAGGGRGVGFPGPLTAGQMFINAHQKLYSYTALQKHWMRQVHNCVRIVSSSSSLEL